MKRKLKQWDNRSYVPRVRGRGDYRATAAKVGRAIQSAGRYAVPAGTFGNMGGHLGGSAGGYLTGGNPLGVLGGVGIGKYAGDKFAQMVGFGDYAVKANSLMDLPMGTGVAAFGNMSNATRVKHREFVQNIVIPPVATAFSNTTIVLQPGLRASFPWLASLAGNYQEYQFIGCVIEFRSLASDSAATLPMGSITIASNYDTADPAYPDKRHMQNSQFCVSGKPSQGLIHPIECDPKLTFVPIKYTRTGAGAANTDNRLYDHANVQIATEGLAGTPGETIGEVWISYDVALYKPQLGSVLGLRDHFFALPEVAGTIDAANEFGSTAQNILPRGGTDQGIGITLQPGGVVRFPATIAPGKYEVTVMLGDTATGFTGNVVWTGSTNVVLSDYYVSGTISNTFANIAGARVLMTAMFIITNPLPVAEDVTLAYTATAALSSVEVQVAAIPISQL